MWVRASTLRVHEHARKSHSLARDSKWLIRIYPPNPVLAARPSLDRHVHLDGRASERASERTRTERIMMCEMATRGRRDLCTMNGRERAQVERKTQCGRGSLRQTTRRPTRRIRWSFFSTLLCRYLSSSLLSDDFTLNELLHLRRAMRSVFVRFTLFLSSGRVVAPANGDYDLCKCFDLPVPRGDAHRALVTSRAESS